MTSQGTPSPLDRQMGSSPLARCLFQSHPGMRSVKSGAKPWKAQATPTSRKGRGQSFKATEQGEKEGIQASFKAGS